MADVDAHQVSLLQSASLTELGARIKHARLAAGLTQTQLGGPEATVSYVSRIESGRRRPDSRVLDAFAERLGVRVEELLDGPPAVNEQETRLAVDFVALSLELGDAADALDQAERLLSDPDVPGTFAERLGFLRGRALEALGRLDDAVQAYEDLLSDHPGGESLTCGIALSRCYRELGDLGRAISVGESLLAQVQERGLSGEDEAVQLTVTVAAAYHERGDVGYAVRLCRSAIAAAEKSGSPRSKAAAYWNAAVMELEAGVVVRAVTLADKALALLGEDADVRNLARLRTQLGIMQLQLDPPQLESAVANLSFAAEQMSISGAGKVDRLYNDLAQAEAAVMSGDVAQAERLAAMVFEQAGSEAPLLAADARTLQGQLAAAAGDMSIAADMFKHAVFLLTGVGADRAAGQRWLELGTLLESVGEEEAARQAYRSAAASAGLRVRPRSVVSIAGSNRPAGT
jgi:transcriptional regulator with XRE-family HTH domain